MRPGRPQTSHACAKTVVSGGEEQAEPPVSVGSTRLAVSQGFSEGSLWHRACDERFVSMPGRS